MIGLCSSVIKGYHPLRSRILLILAAGLVFSPLAFADWTVALKEIYGTPIPTEIRKNFDRFTQTRDTCPKYTLGVLDGEKFMDIYPKKFIVLSLSPNSFGGYWAFIAVQGERKNTYRLWLYNMGDNEYDLRSIEELPNSLDEEFNGQLKNPAYRPYWV